MRADTTALGFGSLTAAWSGDGCPAAGSYPSRRGPGTGIQLIAVLRNEIGGRGTNLLKHSDGGSIIDDGGSDVRDILVL